MASGTSGARGITYESRMCMFLFIRGYTNSLRDFKLNYQMKDAQKFDDVVFDEGGESYYLFQLKHKENQLRISHSHLFSEKFNTDYNLLKYVWSFQQLQSTAKFKNKVKAAVIFTNIDFELKQNELGLIVNQRPSATMWYAGLKSLPLTPITFDDHKIYNFTSAFPKAKYYKFENVPYIVDILKRQAITLANEVGSITEDEIRQALHHIVYAVCQPNDQELEEIVKNEIKNHFKIHHPDMIYGVLENLIRNWCDTNENIGNKRQKQEFLTFIDANLFFERHVKRISFGVVAPISAFTGRIEELEEIKNKLSKQTNIIVTQSLTISGLGGIGKTQLTKQFIKQFGESDFYGRVIWIEAESDDSVKRSFIQFAELINIRDVRTKDSKALIEEVFQFFDGVKVLFVFDNYDINASDKEGLVIYCFKSVSNPTKKFRPFFLVTSRNREILPGIPLLDLDVFSPKDAVQLIENELADLKHTRKDAEDLAESLHYFPLALRQAISYISEQYKLKNIFGERYNIQDFIENFIEEQHTLLNHKFPDEFGEYEKTTLTTWNVTLEAMGKREVDGEKAIAALQIFAYLYADKISPEIFIPLFNNNKDDAARAILLLEKYSMVTKIDEESKFYQIHRLVQAVVRFKFKMFEEQNIQLTLKLINPHVYHQYFKLNRYRRQSFEVFVDQLIHYNNLSHYIQKGMKIEAKFKSFLKDLYDTFLFEAAIHDDVNQIRTLNAPKQEFIHRNIQELITLHSNKIIKYFVDISCLGLNDKIHGESLLEISLKENNIEMFQFFIEKGASAESIFKSITGELISNIIYGKSDIVQNAVNYESATNKEILNEALFIATLFDKEQIIEILVKYEVQPTFQYQNWSSIFVAIKLNHINTFKVLVLACQKHELRKLLVQLWDWEEFASKDTFEYTFKEYIRKSGHINDKDNDGNTLLCYTTSNLHLNSEKLEIIKFLINNGADAFIRNNQGKNALNHIIKKLENDNRDSYFFDEILSKIFLSELTTEKAFNVIIEGLFKIRKWKESGSLVIFENLLQRIGGINARNNKNETLLITAVKDPECKIENIVVLVTYGIDISAIDETGRTAVEYAYHLMKPQILSYLLSRIQDSFAINTILMLTIQEDNYLICKILLENHVPGVLQFPDGKSFIEIAIENVSLETVLLLKDHLKKFCNKNRRLINKRDADGKTLLIKLIEKLLIERYDGDIRDVKLLIKCGVDIHLKDINGKTALDYALQKYRNDIVLIRLLQGYTFAIFVQECYPLVLTYVGFLALIVFIFLFNKKP